MSEAVRIGLNDSDETVRTGIPLHGLTEFNPQTQAESDPFFISDQSGIALGLPYSNREDNLLVDLTLNNSTGSYIDQLTFAFDFLYLLPEDKEGDVSFRFSYRVANGKWISPEGARFSSSMLESYRDGWNSFSLQLSANDLFIRPNDSFEVRWSSESEEAYTYVPIALQRLELMPETAEKPTLKKGTLVISEILPFTENQSENYAAEYIELYNLADHTVNLKGFSIRAGDSEFLIQRDLFIEPYETAVLGYTENLDFLNSAINYHYDEPLIRDHSGSIYFSAGNEDLVWATYQVGEAGRALVLDHVASAFDGYSSLQNFVPSESEITKSILGSPGQLHEQRRLYSTQIDQPGWYFISVPGVLSNDLNRVSGADLYRLSENYELKNSTFQELTDRDPFWIYHHGESDMRVFSKSDPEYTNGRFHAVEYNGTLAGGNHTSSPILMNRITRESGLQAFPALLVWDRGSQVFKMVYSEVEEEQVIEPWSAFIAPRLEGELFYDESASRAVSRDYYRRHLSISLLREERGGRFVEVDQPSVVAFFDLPEDTSGARLDLPVMQKPVTADQEEVSPLLYLESHLAAFDANRFIHMPAIPEEPLLLGAGTRLGNNSDTYRISWGDIENFPDYWIIELRDEYSGTRINMRDNRYYEFRSRGSRNNDQHNEQEVSFTPYSPEQPSDRFFIYISPYPELYDIQQETGELPESIKLHQNYPNPFNPATTISFYLPERSQVRLGIYNVVGQQVGMLKDEQMTEGDHTVVWNAIDMPSGIYIVQLETSGNVLTRKITLIK